MIAVNAFGTSASSWMGASRMGDATMGLRGTCAVRLFDRRTGAAHRINGNPLVIFTKRPEEAVADLLDGRDPSIWEARIETLGSEGAR